jgi:hypothetical protein
MFSAAHQPAVSNSLLNEVATSGIFPDPALFVYSVLGALGVASLLVAYVIFGRSAGRAPRSESVGARVAASKTVNARGQTPNAVCSRAG